MQVREQIEKKRRRRKQPVNIHISTFGLLNRNGLEITNGIELVPVEEEHENKRPEFADWSMPEQRPGYIKMRPHDFL